MVANGCTDWTYDCQPATNNVTYGRGLYNTELWDKMNEHHCDYSGCEFGNNPSDLCMSYLDQVNLAVADVDLYNLYLPVWGYESSQMCSPEENEKARKDMADG